MLSVLRYPNERLHACVFNKDQGEVWRRRGLLQRNERKKSRTDEITRGGGGFWLEWHLEILVSVCDTGGGLLQVTCKD